jgi:hypothetical protein
MAMTTTANDRPGPELTSFQISLPGDQGQAEIASLYRWLGQDPEVGRQAVLSLASSPAQPGAMGPDLDLINVVLSNSIAAVSALIAAIGLWRSTRPQAPEIRIETVQIVVIMSAADPRAERDLAAELGRSS